MYDDVSAVGGFMLDATRGIFSGAIICRQDARCCWDVWTGEHLVDFFSDGVDVANLSSPFR